MKKTIALLLVLVMTLSLCACAGSGETQETQGAAAGAPEGLQIGYSKINITPDFSVGMGGYSDSETRKSEGFVDYIYITCIAATSGEETILMYTLDNCAASKGVADKIRGAVTPATGIEGNKIFVGATHAHSCPSLSTADDALSKYYQMVLNAAVESATKALADRSEAKMLAAMPTIEGMNFVRHYKMSDGTYAGSNFGSFANNTPIEHAAESDKRMAMVKFDYVDESKKDILMINWQAHPDSASEIGYNTIAASWPGPLRDTLEQKSGCHVAYFTGPSGNQTKTSKIPELNHGIGGWREYGVHMGELVAGLLDQLKPVEGTAIKTTGTMFEVQIDHSWDHMLAQANEVYELWKSTGKSAGDALGKTYNFTSSYQARAIRTRASKGVSEKLEVNAFSIGGVGFTTGTYEMFSTSSIYVKDNSPFEVTFLITGNSGYIPSLEAFNYRCYEADTGMYAAGEAEKLAENYVKMLKEVKS